LKQNEERSLHVIPNVHDINPFQIPKPEGSDKTKISICLEIQAYVFTRQHANFVTVPLPS
jgi:hypothetical protein